MRIIAGKYGRRRFAPPAHLKLRPTTDLAKEALFSSLQAEYNLNDVSVLDLFAGTGGIGLEFLSRGASRVLFVEKNRRHAAFIKQVVAELEEDAHARVEVGDVWKFLQSQTPVMAASEPFQFVFADPPYELQEIEQLPQLVRESGLLAPGRPFILEHPDKFSFREMPGFQKHRSYSAVNFSFFVFD